MTRVIQKRGIQKFLYTPGKKEAEEEQWTPKTTGSKPVAEAPVDLSEVWSIKKNVSLGSLTKRAPDRLNHNGNKGYYSRHMKDGGKNAKPPEKSDVGAAWGSGSARGNSMSYSYATQTGSDNPATRSGKGPHGAKLSGGPAGPLDDREF